jgi:hypothetical protein
VGNAPPENESSDAGGFCLRWPNLEESAVDGRSLGKLPRNSKLYHNEPFGPIDTIVVVDHVEELITEMNISNGCLVSSIACEHPKTAKTLAEQLRGFKVGVNAMRSRGDREEPFGGIGQSWKGCFVGGKYLVQSVTQGAAGEKRHGHSPDYTLLPDAGRRPHAASRRQ